MKNQKFETMAQFLRFYRKLVKLGWTARLCGKDQVLRLIAPGQVKPCYCPLTGTCKARTGRYFSINKEFDDAYNNLFASFGLQFYITSAADKKDYKERRFPNLREQLLKPFGLTAIS